MIGRDDVKGHFSFFLFPDDGRSIVRVKALSIELDGELVATTTSSTIWWATDLNHNHTVLGILFDIERHTPSPKSEGLGGVVSEMRSCSSSLGDIVSGLYHCSLTPGTIERSGGASIGSQSAGIQLQFSEADLFSIASARNREQ